MVVLAEALAGLGSRVVIYDQYTLHMLPSGCTNLFISDIDIHANSMHACICKISKLKAHAHQQINNKK